MRHTRLGAPKKPVTRVYCGGSVNTVDAKKYKAEIAKNASQTQNPENK